MKDNTIIMYAKPIVDADKERMKTDIIEKRNSGTYYTNRPHLAIICNQEDDASMRYVKNKQKIATDIGIETTVTFIDSNTSYNQILNYITQFNHDNTIHGIILQLPLPNQLKHLTDVLIEHINPIKDVDGLTMHNKVRLGTSYFHYVPCTPMGVLRLLKYYNITTVDRSVVILGRSELVGRPLAKILSSPPYNAMVTLVHSKISNHLSDEVLENADIIISATGSRHTVHAHNNSMYSPTVIDVGINTDENGKLCGDVDYDCIVQDCHAITPVPGGVGPMTVISLMENVVKAWDIQCRPISQ
jgi:methylenetetrahydrofolate dehydrogenase (NADP+)/methenyltetrahydrofolate cyclohydrolase